MNPISTPYLLLGDSRKRALASHVRARVESWQLGWLEAGSPQAEVDVSTSESYPDVRLHDAVGFRAVAGAGQGASLVFLVPARCVPRLVGMRIDPGECAGRHSEGHSLAAQLEREALRQLAQEFRSGMQGALSIEPLSAPPVAVLREYSLLRFITVLVLMGEPKVPLLMMLSPDLVSAALPIARKPPVSERIERRKSAVTQENVAVEALLGHAEVSLSELASLAVGDVIVLEEALTESGNLRIRDGAHVAAAALGRMGGRRAIQIRKENV